MVRNATKLYYPVKASIESILPLVDEFVVALGNCDRDDTTEQEIRSIGSDKIRVINTHWDLEKFPRGTIHAHQSNVAKRECSGDWLFYLQSDEVIHEKFLPVIKRRCQELLDDREVEGLLFNYRHFWGDYNHYVRSHAWYPKEIRIVRNDPEIYSWWTAQSFRRIPNFDGVHYRVRENTFKLRVAPVDADVYHYGFVRPPHLMQKKRKAFDVIHWGNSIADERHKNDAARYNYGDLSKLKHFNESHPAVMKPFIDGFNWGDELEAASRNGYQKQKHDRLKYRLLTFVEDKLLNGRQLFGFKNYKLVKKAPPARRRFKESHRLLAKGLNALTMLINSMRYPS